MIEETHKVFYVLFKDMRTNQILKYEVSKLIYDKNYEHIRKLIKEGYLIPIKKEDSEFLGYEEGKYGK